MKYQIGQEVWWARFESSESSVECPDCAGSGHIRCIMGDGAEVTIDCSNCRVGYETFSRGRIKTYNRTPKVEKTAITGMNVTSARTEYRIPTSYVIPEDRLFKTEAEAQICAQVLADNASCEELNRIAFKEKDTKSWAWNASYHRRCIRDAKKQIDYHTRKLDVAGEQAKVQKRRSIEDVTV